MIGTCYCFVANFIGKASKIAPSWRLFDRGELAKSHILRADLALAID
jgi:hypothetical protein